MVVLHVKHGGREEFLMEAALEATVEETARRAAELHNGRLKVERVCCELKQLAQHGPQLPPEMLGLTDEQVEELKLVDPWLERCVPSGGVDTAPDPVGRRCGRCPRAPMQQVLRKAGEVARAAVSKDQVVRGNVLTARTVQEALAEVRGAVAIVYPMKLPPHDPVRLELENAEQLEGTQASLEVLDPACAQLWFCGRELPRGDHNARLRDFLGRHENTKVILKLTRRGEGAPAREPVLTEDQRKQLMLHAYRKQEELKKLEADEDDAYLDSQWADSANLKRSFHGLNNISWRPTK